VVTSCWTIDINIIIIINIIINIIIDIIINIITGILLIYSVELFFMTSCVTLRPREQHL